MNKLIVIATIVSLSGLTACSDGNPVKPPYAFPNCARRERPTRKARQILFFAPSSINLGRAGRNGNFLLGTPLQNPALAGQRATVRSSSVPRPCPVSHTRNRRRIPEHLPGVARWRTPRLWTFAPTPTCHLTKGRTNDEISCHTGRQAL